MRIEQLTFTRFIAAISIVIYHYGTNSFLFNNDYVSFIFKQANVGVSYFFILSGFVLTIAYSNRDSFSTKEYLINRVARIYPLYLFALLLYLISLFIGDIYYKEVLLSAAMLQAWTPDLALTLNYPGWSISVELFFYLSFPFLFYQIKKSSLKKAVLTILAFWLISQVVYHLAINEIVTIPFYSIRDLSYHPLFHLNGFLMGIGTGVFFLKAKKFNLNSFKSNALIAFNILIILLLLRYPTSLSYHNGLLAIVFVPLIYLLSSNNGMLTLLFSKKPLIYLGEISFGIYLLQAPIWRIISDERLEQYFGILKNDIDDTVSFLFRLTALLILAILSYQFIENPLRNLIKRRNTKNQPLN